MIDTMSAAQLERALAKAEAMLNHNEQMRRAMECQNISANELFDILRDYDQQDIVIRIARDRIEDLLGESV